MRSSAQTCWSRGQAGSQLTAITNFKIDTDGNFWFGVSFNNAEPVP
jgi:hypothetical protein